MKVLKKVSDQLKSSLQGNFVVTLSMIEVEDFEIYKWINAR